MLLFLVSSVFAHSGGTDSYGCHSGSEDYHCHGGWKTILDFEDVSITGSLVKPSTQLVYEPIRDTSCARYGGRVYAECRLNPYFEELRRLCFQIDSDDVQSYLSLLKHGVSDMNPTVLNMDSVAYRLYNYDNVSLYYEYQASQWEGCLFKDSLDAVGIEPYVIAHKHFSEDDEFGELFDVFEISSSLGFFGVCAEDSTFNDDPRLSQRNYCHKGYRKEIAPSIWLRQESSLRSYDSTAWWEQMDFQSHYTIINSWLIVVEHEGVYGVLYRSVSDPNNATKDIDPYFNRKAFKKYERKAFQMYSMQEVAQ